MGIEKAAWLQSLCTDKFFKGCSIHEMAKKNEKNICCLDCCTSICPHCVHSHRFHRLLQVRRYVYHDVVRLEDLEKLFDCSNVQAYTINAAKVVFIRKRPQNRHFKGSGNYCTSCDRSLQEPFYHCSLGCKVEFVLKHYRDLSPFLRKCKTLKLGPDFFIPQDTGDDINIDQEMTNESPHSTIVDSDEQPMSYNYNDSSGSSGSENMSSSSSMLCTEFVRKKRSGVVYVCEMNNIIRSSSNNNNKLRSEEDIATSMSRRKGIPQRSPMC
ncbi:PLATZ transcription factor family protein [Heracleum sosnowskyi]|uniref:PLATZ transcription factor family protein n=1 Tax=Heracleum sosnowskyi TaxID=360622 RepID=A0AAD8NBY4_9APIA|nr:PLATZ transcription factor family protein [Heracleum sosnowskyi]